MKKRGKYRVEKHLNCLCSDIDSYSRTRGKNVILCYLFCLENKVYSNLSACRIRSSSLTITQTARCQHRQSIFFFFTDRKKSIARISQPRCLICHYEMGYQTIPIWADVFQGPFPGPNWYLVVLWALYTLVLLPQSPYSGKTYQKDEPEFLWGFVLTRKPCLWKDEATSLGDGQFWKVFVSICLLKRGRKRMLQF